MNPLENIGIVVSIVVATIACVLSLLAAFNANKKAQLVEGRHLQEVVALKERVCAQNGISESVHDMAGDIKEIKADIRWLKHAIGKDDGK